MTAVLRTSGFQSLRLNARSPKLCDDIPGPMDSPYSFQQLLVLGGKFGRGPVPGALRAHGLCDAFTASSCKLVCV